MDIAKPLQQHLQIFSSAIVLLVYCGDGHKFQAKSIRRIR